MSFQQIFDTNSELYKIESHIKTALCCLRDQSIVSNYHLAPFISPEVDNAVKDILFFYHRILQVFEFAKEPIDIFRILDEDKKSSDTPEQEEQNLEYNMALIEAANKIQNPFAILRNRQYLQQTLYEILKLIDAENHNATIDKLDRQIIDLKLQAFKNFVTPLIKYEYQIRQIWGLKTPSISWEVSEFFIKESNWKTYCISQVLHMNCLGTYIHMTPMCTCANADLQNIQDLKKENHGFNIIEYCQLNMGSLKQDFIKNDLVVKLFLTEKEQAAQMINNISLDLQPFNPLWSQALELFCQFFDEYFQVKVDDQQCGSFLCQNIIRARHSPKIYSQIPNYNIFAPTMILQQYQEHKDSQEEEEDYDHYVIIRGNTEMPQIVKQNIITQNIKLNRQTQKREIDKDVNDNVEVDVFNKNQTPNKEKILDVINYDNFFPLKISLYQDKHIFETNISLPFPGSMFVNEYTFEVIEFSKDSKEIIKQNINTFDMQYVFMFVEKEIDISDEKYFPRSKEQLNTKKYNQTSLYFQNANTTTQLSFKLNHQKLKEQISNKLNIENISNSLKIYGQLLPLHLSQHMHFFRGDFQQQAYEIAENRYFLNDPLQSFEFCIKNNFLLPTYNQYQNISFQQFNIIDALQYEVIEQFKQCDTMFQDLQGRNIKYNDIVLLSNYFYGVIHRDGQLWLSINENLVGGIDNINTWTYRNMKVMLSTLFDVLQKRTMNINFGDEFDINVRVISSDKTLSNTGESINIINDSQILLNSLQDNDLRMYENCKQWFMYIDLAKYVQDDMILRKTTLQIIEKQMVELKTHLTIINKEQDLNQLSLHLEQKLEEQIQYFKDIWEIYTRVNNIIGDYNDYNEFSQNISVQSYLAEETPEHSILQLFLFRKSVKQLKIEQYLILQKIVSGDDIDYSKIITQIEIVRSLIKIMDDQIKYCENDITLAQNKLIEVKDNNTNILNEINWISQQINNIKKQRQKTRNVAQLKKQQQLIDLIELDIRKILQLKSALGSPHPFDYPFPITNIAQFEQFKWMIFSAINNYVPDCKALEQILDLLESTRQRYQQFSKYVNIQINLFENESEIQRLLSLRQEAKIKSKLHDAKVKTIQEQINKQFILWEKEFIEWKINQNKIQIQSSPNTAQTTIPKSDINVTDDVSRIILAPEQQGDERFSVFAFFNQEQQEPIPNLSIKYPQSLYDYKYEILSNYKNTLQNI